MEAEDKIITFRTYYDPTLAHIVRARLEDSGIACFIADENMGSVYPTYNATVGGIKIKIFARDLEKCEAIIAEDNSLTVEDVAADEQLKCPYCASTNIRYGFTADDNAGWFNRLVSVLKPGADKWHCLNCGKDFEE